MIKLNLFFAKWKNNESWSVVFSFNSKNRRRKYFRNARHFPSYIRRHSSDDRQAEKMRFIFKENVTGDWKVSLHKTAQR